MQLSTHQLIQGRCYHDHWDLSNWRAAQRASSAVVAISHRAAGHIGTETKRQSESQERSQQRLGCEHRPSTVVLRVLVAPLGKHSSAEEDL